VKRTPTERRKKAPPNNKIANKISIGLIYKIIKLNSKLVFVVVIFHL
jgi:hypothetical protein